MVPKSFHTFKKHIFNLMESKGLEYAGLAKMYNKSHKSQKKNTKKNEAKQPITIIMVIICHSDAKKKKHPEKSPYKHYL